MRALARPLSVRHEHLEGLVELLDPVVHASEQRLIVGSTPLALA
jgi:hypothetical protein